MKECFTLLILLAIMAISGFVINPHVNNFLAGNPPDVTIPPIKSPFRQPKPVIFMDSSTNSTLEVQLV